MRDTKFLICGPHQAGKSAFMAFVAQHFQPQRDFPETGQEPAQTGLEFGTTQVTPDLKYVFYSSPSPRRFDFLWGIMAEDCSGYILIVDSTRPETFAEARYALEQLINYRPVPFIVVANKQDLPNAFTPEMISQAFRLDTSANVIPCIARAKPSVQTAFEVLLTLATT